MINPGQIIDGRYEILKEIGRGGMSIVYLAMDNRLNKSIVIKEIRKRDNSNNKLLMESLKRESDLLKNLDHPSLPKIYDIINGEDIYVVMDYIEGQSLNQKLKQEKVISAEQVIDWGKQLSSVLYYLHTRPTPIIYRDMKPDNVMLTPEGKIKLIDFGISREYKAESTTDTTNLGTRSFAAPEQIAGKQTDARTDIYSLGVTLYNLVTGKSLNEPPFELRPIRTWNPSLPEGLEYIIDKCTKAEPENRYRNCNELLHDLENIDKLTKGYKLSLVKKLRRFIASAAVFIIFTTISINGYMRISSENYKNYKSYINKADSYLIEGNYSEAINILDEAINEVDGSKSEAYIKILNIYISMGDSTAGLDKVEESINNKYEGINKNDEVLYKVAMTYFNDKKYQMASKYLNKINEKKIEAVKYYKSLAAISGNMIGENDTSKFEQLKDELDTFEKYNDNLSNDEAKVENYQQMASIYISNKGYFQKLEQEADVNDKIISLVNKAKEVLEILNDESLTIAYDNKLNLKLAQTYHSKGSSTGNSEDLEMAIAYYSGILDSNGADINSTLIKIGEIYSQLQKYDKAIEQYNLVIENDASNIKAHVKLVNALLDSNNKTEAQRIYNVALKINNIEKDTEFIALKRRIEALM